MDTTAEGGSARCGYVRAMLNNGWTLAEHAGAVSRGSSNNGTASGGSELKIAGFTTTGRRADRSRSRF